MVDIDDVVPEDRILEDETFTLTLSGNDTRTIMWALEFTHGFLGGVDVGAQETLVLVNNKIADQIVEQLKDGDSDGE